MSGSAPPQSETSALAPGIAGLFIQGIETGLVFSQFSQWCFRAERSEGPALSAVVIFVTVVGFTQSGIYFASAWHNYVQQFGKLLLPNWTDVVQPVLTLLISVPVQALMIRRCYYLVGKNMFILTPLVLLLVASIVMSLWTIATAFRFYFNMVMEDPFLLLQITGISWAFLVTIILPSVLDIILTGILLYYLTRTMKHVYAAHTRKRISRLVNVVWQSALPPTLCAIGICVSYTQFVTSRQKGFQLWLPFFQQIIGKLYVLSMFYLINSQPLHPGEQPTTFVSTLTVPAEAMCTFTIEALGRETRCSDSGAERGTASTVDFAV